MLGRRSVVIHHHDSVPFSVPLFGLKEHGE